MDPEYQNRISELLVKALKDELNVSYPSQGYYGENKKGNSPRKTRFNNALQKSIEVEWVTDFEQGDPLLVVKMEDYYYYVDQGRKPSSKYPPLDSIRRWIRQKPLLWRDEKGRFSRQSVDSKAFLVARSIKEKGYKGINFITKAEDKVLNKLVELGELAAAEFFEKKINDGLVVYQQK